MRNIVSVILVLLGFVFVATETKGQALSRNLPNAFWQAELREINIAQTQRSYLLREPTSHLTGSNKPLVIVLHGGGGNAHNAENMSGFSRLVNSKEIYVVYPNGSGPRENTLLTWNAKHCCGFAMTQNSDDVAFISALIDKLASDYPIDTRRIYVTGMSNGAMMAHRLGIELPHKITAIAPVAGTLFGDEQMPDSAVSALIINGALDENVPLTGGHSDGLGARAWDGTPAKPSIFQSEFWAMANNCDTRPVETSIGQIHRIRYACQNRSRVEQIIVLDNGHAWPGGQAGRARAAPPSQSFDATEAIWDFFSNQTK